jgi:hypothetical protein
MAAAACFEVIPMSGRNGPVAGTGVACALIDRAPPAAGVRVDRLEM